LDLLMDPTIAWYRTSLDPDLLTNLNKRSNVKGTLQAVGHLSCMIATGVVVIICASNGSWTWLVGALFLHGTVCAFTINGVHELAHNTVFRTRWLNTAFGYVYAFIGWHNHFAFWGSHTEHHKHTLHPPYDLEVVQPEVFTIRGYFFQALINLPWLRDVPKLHWQYATGQFNNEWDQHCFPDNNPAGRRPVIWWSRILLSGHVLILFAAMATGQWIIPIVFSLAPAYGAWLFFLCNNTQHCGLMDNVNDFRLCARTIDLNPVLRFFYWQMNHHIEHHMYAAVPCYNLHNLHKALVPDLPPTPKGLLQVWIEINEIMQRQRTDPRYRYAQPLPLRRDSRHSL